METSKELKKFRKNFLKEVKCHKFIIIFHHIRPDGDCLGSQQGLKIWLQNNFPDKKIYAIGSNEGLFDYLNFEFDSIPNDEILKESLGIVVDANYSDRIINNELIISKKLKTLIRIDHHPEDDDVNFKFRFVDSSYCSSAEQITHLIYSINHKKPLDKKTATFLYLGIYTDSGRFFYDYTSSRTHELTSWLFKSEFDFFKLHKDLSKRTIEEIKFNQYVLSNYKTCKNVIYCYITCEAINKLKIKESSSNRVDFLSNIEGYNIWIFFIQNKDGSIRVRLRSNAKDISILARQYNGGGHKMASGAIIYDEKLINDIVEKATKL